MKVYIAGPITDNPNYVGEFGYAADFLSRSGYQVANPAALGTRPGWGWSDYMRATITLMLGCHGCQDLRERERERNARRRGLSAPEATLPPVDPDEWAHVRVGAGVRPRGGA